MAEQRAHPRYAIELDAVLEPDGGGAHIHGRTQDISRGGFCMLAAAATQVVAAAIPCNVRLALVFSETEFSETLTLRGSIAWCTKLKNGVQLGVKFDALDAQSRGYLDLFIKFLEDGRDDSEEPPSDSGED
jgi:hypothetical protein